MNPSTTIITLRNSEVTVILDIVFFMNKRQEWQLWFFSAHLSHTLSVFPFLSSSFCLSLQASLSVAGSWCYRIDSNGEQQLHSNNKEGPEAPGRK